ncbi:UDP-sugar transporter UST74c-like [Neocloeon triangulifer]|uniref:UDP-sugar transporter UST74c-like n=1 Tax=Neocloeon triangulifer TaxID=2078957 RepID=UPI00286EEA3C|nr:UDP-sugar transporter UST74c-like [Neocloeon triangulifer]
MASVEQPEKQPLLEEQTEVEVKEELDEAPKSTWWQRVGSALFYCVGSFVITLSNKAVLTSFGFPSADVLGLCQLVATVVVLAVGRLFGVVRIPEMTLEIFLQVWPLPGLFLGNLLFGLVGMQYLSLPIFIALRRFTIVMTLLAEVLILRSVPRASVLLAVGVMTLGAVVAAMNDLSVTLLGVVYVLLNNACSATQGVFVKRCVAQLGPLGVLHYNALLALPLTALLVASSGGVVAAWNFDAWNDWQFVLLFAVSCVMGVVLQYSVVLCVHHNSPLTAATMGSVKNVSVTYIGMFVGGDYVFTMLNFIGLNVSVAGTILYMWVTFKK